MDTTQFRKYGKEMVDYIADYCDNIKSREVNHTVKPGYLQKLVPMTAPEEGELWEDIVADIERVIMPGMSHWRSPRFHGYFAGGGSFPSLMGDMLCDAFSCIGFTWDVSPACTELEMVTTDWLGRMLGLPQTFLHSGEGTGGGVIQTAASETVFLCMLAARNKKVKEIQTKDSGMSRHEILSKLTCYSSVQANASVHKAALMAEVTMREIPLDDKLGMDVEALNKSLNEDKENGLIPFFVCSTLGTTGACSFDDLPSIGPLCTQEEVWLHVDAAYAGPAFVCPEFQHYLKGIEHAETLSVNPHKWMLVHFDCSVMWIQHSELLVDAFNVNPIYLKHDNQYKIPDFRHWQIPLGRRFRSLKLWFVLRSYGVAGIQKYIRLHVSMAHLFKDLVLDDGRFEVPVKVEMGLCCFRLKGGNELTQNLLEQIKRDRRIYLIGGSAFVGNKDVYFLRFALVPDSVTADDVKYAYQVVAECASTVLESCINDARPLTSPDIVINNVSTQDKKDEVIKFQQIEDKNLVNEKELQEMKNIYDELLNKS